MPPQEEEEHDDEEMGVAETYADYWPAKCKRKDVTLQNDKLMFKIFSETGKKTSRSGSRNSIFIIS